MNILENNNYTHKAADGRTYRLGATIPDEVLEGLSVPQIENRLQTEFDKLGKKVTQGALRQTAIIISASQSE